MDYDGLMQLGKGLAICYGILALLSTFAVAWFLPKMKASRPRILPPQADDIDDADVLRGPELTDEEKHLLSSATNARRLKDAVCRSMKQQPPA